jgi:hypothetical protein
VPNLKKTGEPFREQRLDRNQYSRSGEEDAERHNEHA